MSADNVIVGFLRAVMQGDAEAVKAGLAAGAPVNIIINIQGTRKTPLHFAAVGGHASVSQVLLEGGSDKEARDENGMTPLHVAANLGRDAVVQVLVQAGVDKEARESKDGLTALHFAACGGHLSVITTLLEAGVDKDVLDSRGCTALHYAAMGGYATVVETLLAAGANSEIIADGMTAFQVAESHGYQAICDLIRNKRL
jgi:ankyrin repeat protein